MAMTSTACPVWFSTVLPIETRSGKAMATPSDEFLVRLRYWPINGGTITRSACGKVTRRVTWPRAQAERGSGLGLAAPDRGEAAAHDLGDIACRVEREADQHGGEFRRDRPRRR